MRPRPPRTIAAAVAGVAVGVLGLALWSGNDLLRLLQSDQPSVSHGSVSHGHLEHGKRLPSSGPNFRAHSRLAALLGRTSVHSTVRDILLDTFAELAVTHPDVRWVYGETGWPGGGPFPPHRTHQNGLAVDLMVPLRTSDGRARTVPTWPWLLWGYRVELDPQGRLSGLGQHPAALDAAAFDPAALAAELRALHRAAAAHHARIDQVIFDPGLQPLVFQADPALRTRLPWSKTQAWVRHDEHIHVVFALSEPPGP